MSWRIVSARLAAILCLLTLTILGPSQSAHPRSDLHRAVATAAPICPQAGPSDRSDAPPRPSHDCAHCILCAVASPLDLHATLGGVSSSILLRSSSAPAWIIADSAGGHRPAASGRWLSGAPPPAA
jgi:hypothetical protein